MTLIEVYLPLLLAAVVIIIGSLGSYLFRKTGIPDMLFLVFLGIFFGPILGFIELEAIAPLAPYLAVLALIIILLDGGMNLKLQRLVSESPRAVALAVISFLLSVILIAVITRATLQFRWTESLLIGSILGGSSSIVVVSLASKLKISDKGATTLVIESAISDIFCIIATLTMIGVIVSGLPAMDAFLRVVTSHFTTGAVFGLILGLIWLGILPRMKDEPYRYMLTLAVLFLTYLISEYLGGSGALSVLVFGIILGNEEGISNLLHRKNRPVVMDEFRRLESEFAFLIKTFFFVYLGLIVSFPDITLVTLGVIISIFLLVVRHLSVRVATFHSTLSQDRKMMTFVFTRGLAAAVLAVLPQEFNLPNSEIYMPIALTVILTTAIITTIGASIISHSKISVSESYPRYYPSEKNTNSTNR
jgi:cell volume regulation protein A